MLLKGSLRAPFLKPTPQHWPSSPVSPAMGQHPATNLPRKYKFRQQRLCPNVLILHMVCGSDHNCEIPLTVTSQYFLNVLVFFSGGCSYPTPQLQIQPSLHESFQVLSSLGYPKRNKQPLFRIWGGKSARERRNVRETRV